MLNYVETVVFLVIIVGNVDHELSPLFKRERRSLKFVIFHAVVNFFHRSQQHIINKASNRSYCILQFYLHAHRRPSERESLKFRKWLLHGSYSYIVNSTPCHSTRAISARKHGKQSDSNVRIGQTMRKKVAKGRATGRDKFLWWRTELKRFDI